MSVVTRIRCDQCNRELSRDKVGYWFQVDQRELDDARDFCSLPCLIVWANSRQIAGPPVEEEPF